MALGFNMKMNKQGFMLLDCVLGAALVAVTSILVLESTSALFKWTKLRTTNEEARNILTDQRKHYELGNDLGDKQSGYFTDGTLFEIETKTDNTTMPPLERSIINLSWSRYGSDEKYTTQTVGVRLRK